MKKQYMSWDLFEDAIEELCQKIVRSGFQFKNIYGIPRGGLIPAVMLSHKLEIPFTQELSLYERVTLVVDDICDTGNTLQKYISLGFPTATLYLRSNCEIRPTFIFDTVNDEYISFPWEDVDAEPIVDYLNSPTNKREVILKEILKDMNSY